MEYVEFCVYMDIGELNVFKRYCNSREDKMLEKQRRYILMLR
jgi:hypothetical protein